MDIGSSAPFEWRNITIAPHPHSKRNSYQAPSLTIKALLNDVESPLGGNKVCKLQPHLHQAHKGGYRGVLGFGGAYSNFILSLALAGRKANLATVGIIRGEEIPGLPVEQQSQVLAAAATAGMQLHYLDRPTYRQRSTAAMVTSLGEQFPGFLIIPEGGSTIEAARACSALIPDDADAKAITHWAVAAGSGATCAGIAAACAKPQKVLAFAVVQDAALQAKACSWAKLLASQAGKQDTTASLQWLSGSSSAAFGQLDRRLCDLINNCYESSGVLLDPVYTVKVLHSLQSLAEQGRFTATDRIALIHTGGLTGWMGMRDQWKSWLSDEVLRKIASLPWQTELGHNQQV